MNGRHAKLRKPIDDASALWAAGSAMTEDGRLRRGHASTSECGSGMAIHPHASAGVHLPPQKAVSWLIDLSVDLNGELEN